MIEIILGFVGVIENKKNLIKMFRRKNLSTGSIFNF